MILSEKLKSEILYKLDCLLKEIIIQTYLLLGNTYDSKKIINDHMKNILQFVKDVKNNKDIKTQTLILFQKTFQEFDVEIKEIKQEQFFV